MAPSVKNLTATQENAGSIPESGKFPWKDVATRCTGLVWEIPWTVEPGGLQTTGCKESDTARQPDQIPGPLAFCAPVKEM